MILQAITVSASENSKCKRKRPTDEKDVQRILDTVICRLTGYSQADLEKLAGTECSCHCNKKFIKKKKSPF